jgi:hypothetical protein
MEKQYIRKFEDWTTTWKTRLSVYRDGKPISKVIHGGSWLSCITMALQAFRHQIPREEEQEWVDADGVPAWIVVPTEVNYSWGYKAFCRLREACDKEQEKLIAEMEKKRRLRSKATRPRLKPRV